MTRKKTEKSIDVTFVSIMVLGILALGFFLGKPYFAEKQAVLEWDEVAAGNGETKAALSADGSSQSATIQVDAYGYSPSTVIAKKGIPLTLNFKVMNDAGCARAFVVKLANINKVLQPGDDSITFTPQEAGIIPFSCSMNMFKGKIVVAE